jgi:hypothetical protein
LVTKVLPNSAPKPLITLITPAGTYWLSDDGRHLGIVAKYRGKKGKKNEETFTTSYKEILVYAKFCPFTGLPLYETEQEDETI